MFILILSLTALVAAPAICRLIAGSAKTHQFVDGMIFVSLGGLILFEIIPASFEHAGWPALAFAAAGILLPGLSEKYLAHRAQQLHFGTFVLGAVCIILHAATDGAAIRLDEHHHASLALSVGVLLHRIPVGVWIWQTFGTAGKWRLATTLLALIAAGTLVGYSAAHWFTDVVSSYPVAWFQAFVAGTLIHAIVHRLHGTHSHHTRSRWMESLGNACGCLILWLVSQSHVGSGAHEHHADWWHTVGQAFLSLTLESAPALLLAYVVAGLMTAFLSDSHISRLSQGQSWRQAISGVAIGLPLPICSCSVVPLYRTLVRKGTPPAAALAFLVATPELGIDAILISLPLLGETMTVLRVVAAAIVALAVGILIGRFMPPLPGVTGDTTPPEQQANRSWQTKLRQGMREGLVDLVDHTAPWILVGLLLAAMIMPVALNQPLDWLSPSWDVLALGLLGMPLYVCAAGATPLVAVFLASGISPGAAVAFLLTGPATNLTTFGILSKLHGPRKALLFAGAVLGLTTLIGYAINFLLPDFTPNPLKLKDHADSWWQVACAIGLGVLYGYSLIRQGARRFCSEIITPSAEDEGDCGHQHSHQHDHHHHHSGHHHKH